jgi:hypothetical protein
MVEFGLTVPAPSRAEVQSEEDNSCMHALADSWGCIQTIDANLLLSIVK